MKSASNKYLAIFQASIFAMSEAKYTFLLIASQFELGANKTRCNPKSVNPRTTWGKGIKQSISAYDEILIFFYQAFLTGLKALIIPVTLSIEMILETLNYIS